MEKDFDYIVVGAGSAGCALAYRLARSSSAKVLLLEAGSPAKNLAIHIPLGFAFLLKEHNNNWNYKTVAEPHLDKREIELPRGKVFGGCSSINGMVYIRGQKEDFDDWASAGNEGWSYKDVLPYFKRSENNENGESHYHGSGGPLWVGNVENEFPICDDFIAAANEAGHPVNNDVNAESQAGVGFFPHNIKKGKRVSSASAFLKSGEKLNNLTVLPFAEVKKINFSGIKANGLECSLKGKDVTFKAGKEVILCGGAINSPKILELSGIGNKDIIEAQGLELLKELEGVGENLHDHWNVYLKRGVENASTYFTETKPLAFFKNLFRYIFTKKGFLANPAALVAVFYKAIGDDPRPDSQIHFAPAASEVDEKGNMLPIEGITIASCGLRPTSRGSSHIVSADFQVKPAILVNYLATEHDQKVAVAAFRKSRAIFLQQSILPYGGEELAPGDQIQNDEDILHYIQTTGEPVHHLGGTCKMGGDEKAVVDDRLRVRGVEGLRVADASIMPQVVSGNTHAACVMIGEKAADMLLEDN